MRHTRGKSYLSIVDSYTNNNNHETNTKNKKKRMLTLINLHLLTKQKDELQEQWLNALFYENEIRLRSYNKVLNQQTNGDQNNQVL